MKALIIRSKTKVVFLIFICLVSFTCLFVSIEQISSNNSINKTGESVNPFTIKTANNDTSPPLISFIKPDTNSTTITVKSFDIIVNITDENPPLAGNVSIEIFNSSVSFFRASMIEFEENQWLFIWNNITSYLNEKSYNLRVTASDSSSNENTGTSDVVSVFIDVYISRSPSLINGILYVIMVTLIIAGIIVYFNKKRSLLSKRKKEPYN